jgi:hypothetical protein
MYLAATRMLRLYSALTQPLASRSMVVGPKDCVVDHVTHDSTTLTKKAHPKTRWGALWCMSHSGHISPTLTGKTKRCNFGPHIGVPQVIMVCSFSQAHAPIAIQDHADIEKRPPTQTWRTHRFRSNVLSYPISDPSCQPPKYFGIVKCQFPHFSIQYLTSHLQGLCILLRLLVQKMTV